MHAPDGIVIALAADQPDQFDIRMAGEQPDQLATDIPGRPDDPDPDPARPARGSTPRSERGTNAVWLARRGFVGRRHSRMTIQLGCIVMQRLSPASRIRYSVRG